MKKKNNLVIVSVVILAAVAAMTIALLASQKPHAEVPEEPAAAVTVAKAPTLDDVEKHASGLAEKETMTTATTDIKVAKKDGEIVVIAPTQTAEQPAEDAQNQEWDWSAVNNNENYYYGGDDNDYYDGNGGSYSGGYNNGPAFYESNDPAPSTGLQYEGEKMPEFDWSEPTTPAVEPTPEPEPEPAPAPAPEPEPEPEPEPSFTDMYFGTITLDGYESATFAADVPSGTYQLSFVADSTSGTAWFDAELAWEGGILAICDGGYYSTTITVGNYASSILLMADVNELFGVAASDVHIVISELSLVRIG